MISIQKRILLNNNTRVIIQARLGSRRLPGKVLLPIGDNPVIWHVYRRAALAGFPTVVTVPSEDSELVRYLKGQNIPVHWWDGDPNDVLGRFAECVEVCLDGPNHGGKVVRLTADCPFLNPRLLSMLAALPISDAGLDSYVSPVYPERLVPPGYDMEVFSVFMLRWAARAATDRFDREHVTPWIRQRVHGRGYQPANPGTDWPIRLTLDTPEDYAWFQQVAELADVTPPHPTLDELVTVIAEHPELERT